MDAKSFQPKRTSFLYNNKMIVGEGEAWAFPCSHKIMNNIRTLLVVLTVCFVAFLNANAETNTEAKFRIALAERVRPGMSTDDLATVFGSAGKVRLVSNMSAYFQYSATTGWNAIVYCHSISNQFVVLKPEIYFIPIAGDTWNGQPIVARLSGTNVLAVTDRWAIEHNRDLTFYTERRPILDAGGTDPGAKITWTVLYDRVPSRHIGDHFSLTVNDETGGVQYSGGL